MADWAPRRFRFVVFDWDGTLADSTTLIADSIRAACEDIGEPVPDQSAARYVIGLGLADAMRHVAPGLPPARHHELTERYRHHYLTRDDEIPLFEGVRAMLADLGTAGFLLGVATGKSREGLERAMAQQRLAAHFVATRCGDEGFPKPHPDMLLHLIDRVGVEPRETLMIGDTTHDVELAKAAGAAVVAVTYGAHESSTLARLGPLATVDSTSELRRWLRANA
ncbi:MAG: HAD-IIIA family hydrolase [Betaproteobacteria bacterium]